MYVGFIEAIPYAVCSKHNSYHAEKKIESIRRCVVVVIVAQVERKERGCHRIGEFQAGMRMVSIDRSGVKWNLGEEQQAVFFHFVDLFQSAAFHLWLGISLSTTATFHQYCFSEIFSELACVAFLLVSRRVEIDLLVQFLPGGEMEAKVDSPFIDMRVTPGRWSVGAAEGKNRRRPANSLG